MYSTKNKYVIKLWNIRPFLYKKYNTWGVGGDSAPDKSSKQRKSTLTILYSKQFKPFSTPP